MADKLTVQQQAVVENRGGTLLVSAAAGSGKTKVLVDRVIRRIRDDGKNINEFLIITFTNAAASELRAKISSAISEELVQHPGNRHLSKQLNLLHTSQISTVHAFCGALIREYGYLLDIPSDYRMIEGAEQTELLRRQIDAVLEEAYQSPEPDFLRLVDMVSPGRTDEPLAELLERLYEKIMSQPEPVRWLESQNYEIPAQSSFRDSLWGSILLDYVRQELLGLIERYHWAISAMQGDPQLEKSYLPAYQEHLQALQGMLPVLEGPWDSIGPVLVLEKKNTVVRKYEGDKARLEIIKSIKSDAKDKIQQLQSFFLTSDAEAVVRQNEMAGPLHTLLKLLGKIYRRFTGEKRRKNVLDFSDQEHLAIELLLDSDGTPSEIAREVSGRFAEIMVDEYQDSNRVQERIFTAISAGGDENRFLVGDVKQSIYGFRQAEPRLFLEKYNQFPYGDQAVEHDPRKLVLSKNFRSRPEILEAVNHTFCTVMSEQVGEIRYDSDQSLYPGLDSYPQTPVPHVELHFLIPPDKLTERESSGSQEEARWMARRIAEMLNQKIPVRGSDNTLRPVQPEDIAVLFRAGSPIPVFARELRNAGIPVATSKEEPLFETPEVRGLTNLLRVINNPHLDIPLLAVLCGPMFRFSNEQLARIRVESKLPRLYDALRQSKDPVCVQAAERLEALRRQSAQTSAEKLVWSLLYEAGLLTMYSAGENGLQKQRNLLEVYQLAISAASGTYLYLYQLLRALDRAEESGKTITSQTSAGVILTTMHQSKGLEYPVVFLPNLSRKFFQETSETAVRYDSDLGLSSLIYDNRNRARVPSLSFEALGIKQERQQLSEELRLLYVAMTRPRDYLIMSYTGSTKRLSSLLPGVGNPAALWATSTVTRQGDWVLLAALNRIESGELFQLCGKPDCDLLVSDMPWVVKVEETAAVQPLRYISDSKQNAEQAQMIPMPQQLARQLLWTYPHQAATKVPSKLTATQIKGRSKDMEAAELAGEPAGIQIRERYPSLRQPDFITEAKGLTPTERGTAVHLFLQYANYQACKDRSGIEEEKLRLGDEAFMTEEQLEAVEPETIETLFHSELGQRILHAPELIREFKFSMLQEAEGYYPEAAGESVLLQGVVDAALIEPEGICVVDFKTDRVTSESVHARAEEYRAQLQTYRDALSRIFQKPVLEMHLYFLSIGKDVLL